LKSYVPLLLTVISKNVFVTPPSSKVATYFPPTKLKL